METRTPRCLVCGGWLGLRPLFCASCDTPHHWDCWEFLEHCSLFGCGGTRARTADGRLHEYAPLRAPPLGAFLTILATGLLILTSTELSLCGVIAVVILGVVFSPTATRPVQPRVFPERHF